MKQHRTRLAAVAALAAVAVGTIANAPAAQADLGEVTTPTVSIDQMHANVVAKMTGNAYGWQLAIAKDGKLVATDQGGLAISKKDNGGTAVPMTPYMKMELASVTKNITAVATMKLLRRNGLTVESYVAPYLPAGWTKGPGISKLRFRHLLTHTSGFNQAISAMPKDQQPTNNGWSAMQTIVANGTVVDSQRQYKNANFALLRVLNAILWDRSGGRKYTVETVEVENSKGVVIGTKEVKTPVPVTAANHTSYVLDYLRRFIFEPAGLKNVGCIANGSTSGVRSYGVGATATSTGKVLGTGSGECAGARGIALSSVQLLQYAVNLRHGTIINPADLATMDELRAGWNEDSNGGDGGQSGPADGVADNKLSPGVFWHGGDLLATNPGDPELHTCVMTFEGGIEATLLVNSPLKSDSPCGVLIKSWFNAKP